MNDRGPSVTTLELVTAPAVMPITVDEVRAYLRLAADEDSGPLSRLVATVVDEVDGDGQLGRAMIEQTWAQWVPQSPGDVRLRMGPFIELTAVDYYDADGALQSAVLADFEVRKQREFVVVRPKDGANWPVAQSRRDAIRITFKAGFGTAASDVPEGLRHALLLKVQIENDQPFGPERAALMQSVDALINRHRVGWYG